MDVGHAFRDALTVSEARRARRIVRATFAGLFAVLVPGHAGAGSPPDPCSLLSDEDVRALQGHPVLQRVPSAQPPRRFRVAQCVYRTPEITHSVSVAVTSPLTAGPPGAVSAYWKERFSPDAGAVPAKKDPPRPVTGLGDAAFWVGDRVTGALYVLKGDVFVRISVGGVREEGPRLERTKALASRLVERLGDP